MMIDYDLVHVWFCFEGLLFHQFPVVGHGLVLRMVFVFFFLVLILRSRGDDAHGTVTVRKVVMKVERVVVRSWWWCFMHLGDLHSKGCESVCQLPHVEYTMFFLLVTHPHDSSIHLYISKNLNFHRCERIAICGSDSTRFTRGKVNSTRLSCQGSDLFKYHSAPSTRLYFDTPHAHDFGKKSNYQKKKDKHVIWTLSHHLKISEQTKTNSKIDCSGKRNLTAYMCKDMPLVMLFSMNCQSLVQPQHPKSRPRTSQDTTERIKTCCFYVCYLSFGWPSWLIIIQPKKSPTKYATFYYKYM